MTTPDPAQATLAVQIVTLLAVPFVQGVAKQVGQDTFTQARVLLAKVGDRLRQDKNEKASKTLDLFQEDLDTFGEALSRLLAVTLAQHPGWADEMRQLLAEPASQEIIARNNAIVTDIAMRISGAGRQRIKADDSRVEIVEMNIECRSPKRMLRMTTCLGAAYDILHQAGYPLRYKESCARWRNS